MPLYPSKVLQAKERALIPCLSIVFCLGLTFGSLKELGACHYEQFPRYKDAIVSQNHDWLNEWKTITLSIKCCDIIIFARFWDFQLSI
jgi:hypothetical protein